MLYSRDIDGCRLTLIFFFFNMQKGSGRDRRVHRSWQNKIITTSPKSESMHQMSVQSPHDWLRDHSLLWSIFSTSS